MLCSIVSERFLGVVRFLGKIERRQPVWHRAVLGGPKVGSCRYAAESDRAHHERIEVCAGILSRHPRAPTPRTG